MPAAAPAGRRRGSERQERVEEARAGGATAAGGGPGARRGAGSSSSKKMMAEDDRDLHLPPPSTRAKHRAHRGEPAHGAERRRPGRSFGSGQKAAGRFGRRRNERLIGFTDDVGPASSPRLNRCSVSHSSRTSRPVDARSRSKRSIRDLQVWCGSCMVAFAGAEPNRRPDRREAACRDAHSQDRRPMPMAVRAGSWPVISLDVARSSKLARFSVRRELPPPKKCDPHPCLRAVQRKRICPGSGPYRLRPRV